MNNAPDWIQGTFIYALVLPDDGEALSEAGHAIARIADYLDRSVRQVPFLMGAVGVDDTPRASHDGSWPFWNRPTFRVGGSWERLAEFMLQMRERHNTWISFHLNLTDVNRGLDQTPQSRTFRERLRREGCFYTREGGECGRPLHGRARVPLEPELWPRGETRMPYVAPKDAEDILAIVNYKRLWDSGIAREMIDEFYAHLPYAPPVIKLDVFTPGGANLFVGYPDGVLGGALASQMEGRRLIANYLESKGSVVNAEGTQDMPSGWCHGGMANNDYSRIETGFGQGGFAHRSARRMHVYGDGGGYHVLFEGRYKNRQVERRTDERGQLSWVEGGVGTFASDVDEGTRYQGDVRDIVRSFYLTVIQELYHIGRGNTRLPGGANTERLDEAHGRAELVSLALLDEQGALVQELRAQDALMSGSLSLEEVAFVPRHRLLRGLEHAPLNSVTWTLKAPRAGRYQALVRYVSPEGGILGVHLNDISCSPLHCPALEKAGYQSHYPWAKWGDVSLSLHLREGDNSLRLSNALCLAVWDDGTLARWDEEEFSRPERRSRVRARLRPDVAR